MSNESRSYLLVDPKTLERELHRLEYQATTLFTHELPTLKQLGLDQPKVILDIGCGSGHYLDLLGATFPNADLFGFDRHTELLKRADSSTSRAKFVQLDITSEKTLSEAIRATAADTIFLRFVLQHLTNKDIIPLLETIQKNTQKGTLVVLIESDDNNIYTNPKNASVQFLVDRIIRIQSKNGGNRTLGSSLRVLLQESGFQNPRAQEVDMGSSTLGWNNCEAIYLPVWGSGISDKETTTDEKKWIEARNWLRSKHSDINTKLFFPIYIATAYT